MKRREFVVRFVVMWVIAAMLAATPDAGVWRTEREQVGPPMFKACAVEMERMQKGTSVEIVREAANEAAAGLIRGCQRMTELGDSLTESMKRLDAKCKEIDNLFWHSVFDFVGAP